MKRPDELPEIWHDDPQERRTGAGELVVWAFLAAGAVWVVLAALRAWGAQ